MAEQTKYWLFRYHGPRAAVDDRECDLCTAVSTGKNPKKKRPGATYDGNPDRTFGTHSGDAGDPAEHIVRRKAAGKTAHCPNHAGLDAVVAAHKEEHPDHEQAGFDAFVAAIKAQLAAMPGQSTDHVDVIGHGTWDPRLADGSPDYGQPFARFEMSLSVPRSAEEHDKPYQANAPAARAADETAAKVAAGKAA